MNFQVASCGGGALSRAHTPYPRTRIAVRVGPPQAQGDGVVAIDTQLRYNDTEVVARARMRAWRPGSAHWQRRARCQGRVRACVVAARRAVEISCCVHCAGALARLGRPRDRLWITSKIDPKAYCDAPDPKAPPPPIACTHAAKQTHAHAKKAHTRTHARIPKRHSVE